MDHGWKKGTRKRKSKGKCSLAVVAKKAKLPALFSPYL
jgi:hypothetical protein